MVVQFGLRELDWPGGNLHGIAVPAGVCTRDVAFAYRLRDERIIERWAIRDDLGNRFVRILLRTASVLLRPGVVYRSDTGGWRES